MGKRDSYAMVADDDPHWLRFWSVYPRRDAKQDARKAWAQVKPTEEQIVRMEQALAWQRPQWAQDSYKFCPLPATYLRGRRWDDERPGSRGMEQIGSAVRCWYGHQPPCSSSSECRDKFFREARAARQG